MKVNIQKFKNFTKRFIPVLTALVVLVCCVSFSASAEALDYRDYEKYVTVDGDKDLVTVSFPQEWFSGVFTNSSGAGLAWWSGWEFYYEPDSSVTPGCWAYIAPFGGPTASTSFSYSGLYLSLDNIPSDALWHISLAAAAHHGVIDWITIFSCQFRSFSVLDSYATVYEYLDVSPIYDDAYPYRWSVDGCFPAGADGWFPQIILRLDDVRNYPIYIEVTSFTVTLSISSLYRLQEQTGETNDLLDEVNRQLEEQGKTMNDILNGTPEQNEQADQFRDEMDSAIGDLNNAGDVMADVPKPEVDVDDLVPTDILTGSDFLAYTASIKEFWSSDILSSVTTVLGGLLLLSYVLFGEKG